MAVALHHLVQAYRKAKVDLFYSSNSREADLLAYETNLEVNLLDLAKKINGDDFDWIESDLFLGGWTVGPKKLEKTQQPEPNDTTAISASPAEQFAHDISTDNHAYAATYRLMSNCSIDFHVLSTHWALTAGAKMDLTLSPAAVGNRLRRTRDGEINPLSSGTFAPYLVPYKQWSENGLKAIESALADNQRVVAVTGDATSFFHRLNADFLVDPRFLRGFGTEFFTADEERINALFAQALNSWSLKVSEELGVLDRGAGLPVGLPASAIVANLALIDFDRFVESQVAPIYYARYVDDIFIVMRHVAEFTMDSSPWDWIARRTTGPVTVVVDQNGGFSYSTDYLGESTIQFSNHKNKTYHLHGTTGKALLASLRRNVAEAASEWRSLPVLPSESDTVGTRIVSALQNSGAPADSFRKTDHISAKRAKFAIQLRDFEAFALDLNRESWNSIRHDFFRSVCDYVLEPQGLFELATYLPRIFRLALKCGDAVEFREMLEQIRASFVSLSRLPVGELAGFGKIVPDPGIAWKARIAQIAWQVVVSSGFKLEASGERQRIAAVFESLGYPLDDLVSDDKISSMHTLLLSHDLAASPLRYAFLPQEISPDSSGRNLLDSIVEEAGIDEIGAIAKAAQTEITQAVKALCQISPCASKNGRHHSGFYFPTRPFSALELNLSIEDSDSAIPSSSAVSVNLIGQILLGMRGFNVVDQLPTWQDSAVGPNLLVPDSDRKKSGRRRIAIASILTPVRDSELAARGVPNLSAERYRKLTSVINNLISLPERADYLIMPELSLPSRWFVRFAQKLSAVGISLVAGIEYIRVPGARKVHNEVWASLVSTALGFRSNYAIRQSKQKPAHGERTSLVSLESISLAPRSTYVRPPVISHQGFAFALVICSEFTNVEYRSSLRGRVDALFVPEWNRDLTTFNALVESAALDVHTFVVQANNRMYGDSRLRSPSQDDWHRDVVRHKGGLHDYIVVGEIDFGKLRDHHSRLFSAALGFKPLPDGFELAPHRK